MKKKEIYIKDIPSLKGIAAATKDGRIYRHSYVDSAGKLIIGRWLKTETKESYIQVAIRGKYYLAHRLIAETFIPNHENKPEINHINGIKGDNRIENLEWVTSSENQLHFCKLESTSTGKQRAGIKLNAFQVRTIRRLLEFSTLTHKQIGKFFGVTQSIVTAINTRKIWKNV